MRARAALLALSLGAAGVGPGCRQRPATPAGPAPAGASAATGHAAVTGSATAPGIATVSGGTRLAAGDLGTCAIAAGGRLYCWGDHEAGDTAGLPGPTHRLPREFPAVPAPVRAVDVGRDGACAIGADHRAWCWSERWQRHRSRQTEHEWRVPEPIVGIPGKVVAVAVGDSAGSCAVTDVGALHCWGDEGALLGLGPRHQRPEPAPAVGITGEVVAVSVGFESVLALTADGTVWGAGLLGSRGQRDRNPPNPAAGFVRLGGGYAGVHAEGFDDYAIDRAGRVHAFRDGAFAPVPGLDAGVRALAGHASLGCALRGDGALWCWGFGYHGVLANGTLVNSERPVRATRLPPMAAVALGSDHGCGLARDGRLLCWGSDEDGAVGVDRRGILEPIEVRLGASTAPPPAPRYLAAPDATRGVPTFAELPDPRGVPCTRSGPPLAAGAGELGSVEGTLAGKGIEGELLRVGSRVFTRWHDAAGDSPAFAGTVDEQGRATLAALSGAEPAPARAATITGQLAPPGTLVGTLARDGARERLELRVTAAIGAAGALTGYGALRGSETLDEPSDENPVGTLAHTWLEVLVDRRGPGAPRLRVAGWREGTSHGACSPGLALVPAAGVFGEQNRGWERVLGARLAPHPIAGTYLRSVTCERAWSIEWLSVFTEEPPAGLVQTTFEVTISGVGLQGRTCLE